MAADRGRAGTRAMTAEHSLDANKRANPKNQTAALLADDFVARSSEYDLLRNRMVEEFVESKHERSPPWKKAVKRTRTPVERAAASTGNTSRNNVPNKTLLVVR